MKENKENKIPKKKKRVAVLMGGPSHEHEVSIKSGNKVVENLHKGKYEVTPVLISKTGSWAFEPKHLAENSDVVFIALHGNYGEDGMAQSMLEAEGIQYTGSGTLASALAMNKFLSGEVFRRNGLAVPLSFLVDKKEWTNNREDVFARIKNYLSFPFVVKPNNQGSSVGVHVVRNWGELTDALYDAFSVSKSVLMQTFIKGVEVSCGVLDFGWQGSEYALLPTEIIPRSSSFFNFDSKYVEGGSEEITPARFQEHVLRDIQRTAIMAHKSVGAKVFSRTDMIVDSRGVIFVLEVNTIPGLTENSLLPKAALASGISFEDLLDRIIEAASKQ